MTTKEGPQPDPQKEGVPSPIEKTEPDLDKISADLDQLWRDAQALHTSIEGVTETKIVKRIWGGPLFFHPSTKLETKPASNFRDYADQMTRHKELEIREDALRAIVDKLDVGPEKNGFIRLLTAIYQQLLRDLGKMTIYH